MNSYELKNSSRTKSEFLKKFMEGKYNASKKGSPKTTGISNTVELYLIMTV